MFSIYICFKGRFKGLLCIYILLLLGFASRIAMGFSPIIWASNDRTFIYMYFSVIICSLILYQEIYELKYKIYRLLYFILCNNLFCIFMQICFYIKNIFK